MKPFALSFLSDPTVFEVNRLPAVSDHDVFATEAEAAADCSSLRKCLSGRWHFRYAQTPETRPVGFQSPDYDCSAWELIDVPAHIQLQGGDSHPYGAPHYVNIQYPWDGHEALVPPQIPQHYNPVGCYAVSFTTPESWRGLRTIVQFNGAESAMFVWVNGRQIGYSEDSFTPSRFDITDALVDGENKLAVEVYRFCTGTWMEDQDFWRFSGLFRDVELFAEPKAHIEDIFVHAEPSDDWQSGTLNAELKLTLPEGKFTLAAELIDSDGRAVEAFAMPAAPDTSFHRVIERVKLWSAEQPNLYTLRLTLKNSEGDVVEVAKTRVGFRRFELKNGLMLLNGQRIRLHGVDRHEFSCKTGRALSREEMLWDVKQMKRHNINAVRTSHYPNHSLWYKLCDEYGIYLIDETNIETHGSWTRGLNDAENSEWALPCDREDWLDAVVDRGRSMLERDKNHPSILFWSCGNESYGGKDLFELSEFFRHRDPSRLVHYEGVCHDRRYNATSDVESRMYAKVAEIEQWLAENDDKPFIECEYTHAMGNSCGGMSKYLELEERLPRYQGGFIWDWIDQAIEDVAPNGKRRLTVGGDYDDQPTNRNFCTNGVIFADRRLSPKMQEIKYLYQDVRIVPAKDGVTLCNRFLFDDLSGYSLEWTLLRDGEPLRRGEIAELCVPVGTDKFYSIALGDMTQIGEYSLLCTLSLKQTTPWAERGFALMHGQAIVANVKARAATVKPDYVIVNGDFNAGAHSDGFEALFSYTEGGLVRLVKRGAPAVLNYVPTPSLFRAPTDNDLGNGNADASALWQTFSLRARGHVTSFSDKGGKLAVGFRYELKSMPSVKLDVTYTVLCEGKLRVKAALSAPKTMGDLPSFGLSFRLPKAFANVRYYGLGPDETYVDRQEGGILAVHETTASACLSPYQLPQECGNRGQVRWLEVTDEARRGLRVRMTDQPLEISVLPHSAAELEAALHQDELADTNYTYLDVAMRRNGIAGDDSWGAPVLDEYRLKAGKYSFSFDLELM